MNLHRIANRAVSVINPNVTGSIFTSAGSTTNADFSRTPTFSETTGVAMQEQPLSANDLRHLDALNIQTVSRSIHVNGQVNGADRATGQGGDYLYFNGRYWLCTIVMEPFDQAGWCRVGVTGQDATPPGLP